MPATAIRPPMIATTNSDPRADSTGNQARVLSDLRTAHERLAISHEVWNRLIGLQYRSRDGPGVVRTPPHCPASVSLRTRRRHSTPGPVAPRMLEGLRAHPDARDGPGTP